MRSGPSRTGAVVAVVAHPDDESLIAGGTLALAAAAGAETGVVSLTRGECGPIATPALATPETLGDVREDELRAAGRALGVSWTTCLRHPDGEVADVETDGAADELVALLQPAEPRAVLTFGPEGLYGHADHVAARQIAGLAVERLQEQAPRRSVCLYEAAWPTDTMPALAAAATAAGLGADLWGIEAAAFGSPNVTPTLVLDVRSVLGQKLAALRAHRTQIGPGHLLASLPDTLAELFLDTESWRRAESGPEQVDALAELLPGRVTAARARA